MDTTVNTQQAGSAGELGRGVKHLDDIFARARQENRAVFMPYLVVGHPDLATSLDLVQGLEAAGADLFELGMPFSDPLADGPVIQAATQHALEQGITVAACLEAAATLRARGVKAGFNLMGYYNPIFSYGLDRFCRDAAAAGVDGVIVPDLPPEESDDLAAACAAHDLALVRFLAPTSTPARQQAVTARAQGFIYLVSLTGVTGLRDALSPELAGFVARVRGQTSIPLAVGFGISQPKHAATVAAIADGVIVGTAVVKRAGSSNPLEEVVTFGRSIATACRR